MKGLISSKMLISNIYSGSEMINQEHFQKVEIKERLEELHRDVIQSRWFISPSDSNFLKKPIENWLWETKFTIIHFFEPPLSAFL